MPLDVECLVYVIIKRRIVDRHRRMTPPISSQSMSCRADRRQDPALINTKAHRHPELTEQTVWEVFERCAGCPRTMGMAGGTASKLGRRYRPTSEGYRHGTAGYSSSDDDDVGS